MIRFASQGLRIRRSTVAALRAGLVDVRPLGERPLVDLLRRERSVATRTVEPWLPHGALDELEAVGMIDRSDAGTTPRVRLDVVDDCLLASDPNRLHGAHDFVAGAAPASLLLARHVPARSGGRLLDLGCGSGILSLLGGDAKTNVTAIDINPRALAFTRFNAALNDRPRLRAYLGSFLGDDPDCSFDGRFDTVVANPPFVLSPKSELTYRDRPLPGDAVGERTIARVARALAPGGRGYVLCNWIHRGSEWSDPVRRWTTSLNADVAVTRVRTLEPPGYVAIWTRWLPADERVAVAREWVNALEAEGVTRIHVGVVVLSRPVRAAWPSAFEALDARPTFEGAAAVAPIPARPPVPAGLPTIS